MRVLVTGGSGFLGSHIIERSLAQGDAVHALVRETSDLSFLETLPEVELFVGDLCRPGSLTRALRGVEVVYHAAARVLDYGTRAEFVAANVRGTEHLLRAAEASGVRRFVFVSSPSVVMTDNDAILQDEMAPYPRRYLNLYAETKAAAERMVLAADRPAFTTCSIRPRGIWGPRDWRGYLPKVIARMRAGRMIDISGGRPVLASICHCQNAAHACRLAATANSVGGKTYFVTDGEPVEVWQFFHEVAASLGVPPIERSLSPAFARLVGTGVDWVWRLPFLGSRRSPPLSRYAVALLANSNTYDISAARRDLGYEAVIRREEGVGELAEWVERIGGLSRYLEVVDPRTEGAREHPN